MTDGFRFIKNVHYFACLMKDATVGVSYSKSIDIGSTKALSLVHDKQGESAQNEIVKKKLKCL